MKEFLSLGLLSKEDLIQILGSQVVKRHLE